MKHIRRVLALVLMAIMVATMASAEVNADITRLTTMDQFDQILASSGLYYGDLGEKENSSAANATIRQFSDYNDVAAKCMSLFVSEPKSIIFIAKYNDTSYGESYIYATKTDSNVYLYRNSRENIESGLSQNPNTRYVMTKGEPKTGDETPVVLLCVLLAGAAAGIIALRRRRAKLMG